MSRKIILFELNEVPFKVLDHFTRWRPNSTFARLLRRCRTFETLAEDRGHLSPWMTWPSLHRGVTGDQHLIHDFGQPLGEVDSEFPPIWKLLTGAGIKTGIGGSLHTYPLPSDLEHYAFILPDTFAAGSECFPTKLSDFQRFNLAMARESARNVESRLPWGDALRFLAAAPDLGLRLATAAEVGTQVVSERVWSWRTVRRRTYQSVLAFDVFMKQLATTKPAFATFFTNHVASSQHRFWAAAFPSDYETFGYTEEWVSTYAREIDFTMRKADAFFSRLVRFADRNPDYVIWIATSMGQAATVARPVETQLYPVNVERLMIALGAQSSKWQRLPAMLPQLNVAVEDDVASTVRESLESLSINGAPINFRASAAGFFSIDFGHGNLYDRPEIARLRGSDVTFASLGLANVEIQDKSGTTAYHIPQGCLVVYDPRFDSAPQARVQISAVELAPAILRNYAIARPSYMRRAPAGLTE